MVSLHGIYKLCDYALDSSRNSSSSSIKFWSHGNFAYSGGIKLHQPFLFSHWFFFQLNFKGIDYSLSKIRFDLTCRLITIGLTGGFFYQRNNNFSWEFPWNGPFECSEFWIFPSCCSQTHGSRGWWFINRLGSLPEHEKRINNRILKYSWVFCFPDLLFC